VIKKLDLVRKMVGSRTFSVAVMGMGYVGLTLSVVLARNGIKVHGIEVNEDVVSQLKSGIPHFQESGLQNLLINQQSRGMLEIESKLQDGVEIDAYIISVGTPLNKGTNEPNIDYIKNVVRDVARHMSPGSLVILRSTVPVGVSREIVIPILEHESGLKVGKEFYFSFAPERTIEGKAIIELEENSQIIGGFDQESVDIASSLFRKITHTIVAVSSIESAEMVKILDNSYRDIRFAYSNEIAIICEKLGLNALELINAANVHYPRNNIPVPSPGVGGACLSKDPHILAHFSRNSGYNPKLIEEGRNVNEKIPFLIVDRISKKLESLNKDISSSKIFIIGFAFKGDPETSDLRDSTTLWLLENLKDKCSNISGYDPVLDENEISELGVVYSDISSGIHNADVVMLMNNHKSYIDFDIQEFAREMNCPGIIYDSWGMVRRSFTEEIPGIEYMGVGF
tara:strand:+ start:1495 stop:2856 length:1362 start_codon:yes stop_codon:yes gene_type:complete